MVFGVFDGLHEGHKHFLKKALEQGELIVVVARDLVVQQLKNKTPKISENERMAAVRNFLRPAKPWRSGVPEATVVLGDEVQGSYEVVKTHQPDMICLGYDQHRLDEDLQRSHHEIRRYYVPKLSEAVSHQR